jgi:hypothetical protein
MLARASLYSLTESLLLLLLLLLLTACATITDRRPKDIDNFAEVDVAMSGGFPQVTIYNVALSTGFNSRYFFTSLEQTKPNKLYLSPGTYLIRATCYGTVYVSMDDVVSHEPELKVNVSAGKKYWLGCKQENKSQTLYFDEQ